MRIFGQMVVFISLLSLVSVIVSDSIKAKRYSQISNDNIKKVIIIRFHWKAFDAIDGLTLETLFLAVLMGFILHSAAIIFYFIFKVC